MNSKDSSEINVQTLLALRKESDALRVITEKLRVKEMGPADHIRTKHEVKIFVESGGVEAAEVLLKRAFARLNVAHLETIKQSQRQELRINP